MNRWTMIKVEYIRIPKTTVYNAVLEVTEVMQEGKEINETLLLGRSLATSSMEEIVKSIHLTLQDYPEALVEMGHRSRKTKLEKLESDLRDMIRDDLPEALEAFKPIHRTVIVREVKEMQ